MKSLVLLLVFSYIATGISAQNEGPSSIHPLSVGDVVPDIVFDNMVNYHSKTARLSDFRDKLIILDFWATWCTSCLQHFPLLDSLQKEFVGKLQVILINAKNTGDKKEKITAFFEKRKPGSNQKYEISTAINDTVADKLFEHNIVPHYVWISEGKVIAITSSDPVNAENIRAIKAGQSVKWMMKRDQDAEKPLFTSNDLILDSLMQYSIFLKGWYDGLPSGTRLRSTNGIYRGVAFTNTCLLNIYEAVAASLIPGFTKKDLVLEIGDSSNLIPDTAYVTREQWYKNHSYNYDMIIPADQSGRLYDYILEDLNRYSGYVGRIERQPVKCFVLKMSKQGMKASSKGGISENNFWKKDEAKYMHNQPVSALVNYLNDILTLPVFDESNFKAPVDLELPVDLTDITPLQKVLSEYGLSLEEMKQKGDVFILSEKLHN
jgi:thiol-disulfide isomerase/thioredoxin